MCWLNSCTVKTKDRAEELLSRPGSSLIPSGVVMRDLETGQMVIVEMGRVVTIQRLDADQLMRGRKPPIPTEKAFSPAGGLPT